MTVLIIISALQLNFQALRGKENAGESISFCLALRMGLNDFSPTDGVQRHSEGGKMPLSPFINAKGSTERTLCCLKFFGVIDLNYSSSSSFFLRVMKAAAAAAARPAVIARAVDAEPVSGTSGSASPSPSGL